MGFTSFSHFKRAYFESAYTLSKYESNTTLPYVPKSFAKKRVHIRNVQYYVVYVNEATHISFIIKMLSKKVSEN